MKCHDIQVGLDIYIKDPWFAILYHSSQKRDREKKGKFSHVIIRRTSKFINI